jgi:hypothetical protein
VWKAINIHERCFPSNPCSPYGIKLTPNFWKKIYKLLEGLSSIERTFRIYCGLIGNTLVPNAAAEFSVPCSFSFGGGGGSVLEFHVRTHLCRQIFGVQLRFSGMNFVEYWKLSSVSAAITIAIFRINMSLCFFGIPIYIYGRQRQRIFPLTSASRLALGPSQPPVHWVPGALCPGVKRGRGVMLTTHPLLVPRLRKSRSYTSSHPNASLWSVTGPLYLCYLYIYGRQWAASGMWQIC